MEELEERYRIEIRRGPLKDDDAARSYLFGVRRTLQAMHFVDSGRLLLEAIRESGKWLWIEPYTVSKHRCNGLATPIDVVERKRHFRSRVHFSPDTGDPKGPCADRIKAGRARGLEPSELLFHELLHAMRQMTGFRAVQPLTGGLKGYATAEELFAVLSTNVYMTDPTNINKTGPRKDWATNDPIDPEMDNSLSFFALSELAFHYVDQFCTDSDRVHNRFTAALARVPSAYNPLTPYFLQRDKAKAVSEILRGLDNLDWHIRSFKVDWDGHMKVLEQAEQHLLRQSGP